MSFPSNVILVGFMGAGKTSTGKELAKLLKEKHSILFIEWADKIKKLLPRRTIWINFKHGEKENERYIKIKKFTAY